MVRKFLDPKKKVPKLLSIHKSNVLWNLKWLICDYHHMQIE